MLDIWKCCSFVYFMGATVNCLIMELFNQLRGLERGSCATRPPPGFSRFCLEFWIPTEAIESSETCKWELKLRIPQSEGGFKLLLDRLWHVLSDFLAWLKSVFPCSRCLEQWELS